MHRYGSSADRFATLVCVDHRSSERITDSQMELVSGQTDHRAINHRTRKALQSILEGKRAIVTDDDRQIGSSGGVEHS